MSSCRVFCLLRSGLEQSSFCVDTLCTMWICLKTHYYNFVINSTFVRACEVTSSFWISYSFLLTYLLTYLLPVTASWDLAPSLLRQL